MILPKKLFILFLFKSPIYFRTHLVRVYENIFNIF